MGLQQDASPVVIAGCKRGSAYQEYPPLATPRSLRAK